MKSEVRLFNLYVMALLTGVAALWAGCKTTAERERAKETTILTFHVEAPSDGTARTKIVDVLRSNPTRVGIQTSPFLDETSVTNAAVVDTVGGFALQIQFDRRGGKVLESVTTAYRGHRIGIFAYFTESRWLAAPRVTAPIVNGMITFTPDASREECERIVRGLLNVYRNRAKKSKTWGLSETE